MIDVVWLAPPRVRTVRIEVSLDGGNTWSLVGTLPTETPRFLWFVSDDMLQNASFVLLRVSDQARPDDGAIRKLTIKQ